MTRPWGCPKCGSSENRVVERLPDEDGNFMRLRRCKCGVKWATEEVAINVSAYYPRVSAYRMEAQRRLRGSKPCHVCHKPYRSGFFRQHVRFSTAHEAALVPRAGNRDRERRRAREYAKRRYWEAA